MRRELAALFVIVGLSAISLAPPAHAQNGPSQGSILRPSIIDDTGMRNNLPPAYYPRGMNTGGFIIYPSLTAELAHDDNLFATPGNKVADWRYSVQPALRVLSNWRRHALNFAAEISSTFHRKVRSENATSWSLGADGRIDVLQSTIISTELSYARRVEARGAITSLSGAAEPTRYGATDAGIEIEHRVNRLSGRLRGAYTDLDYEATALTGGGSLSNQSRNRRVWSAEVRTGYEVSPKASLFARGTYNQVDYRLRPPDVTQDRGSSGFEAGLGIDFQISATLRSTMFVGYRRQSYADPSFNDISGFAYGADINWPITRLTTLRLFADSTIEEAVFSNSSGVLSQSMGLGLTHELLRNVRLEAQVRMARADFRGIGRNDESWNADIKVDYLINRYLAFGLGYGLRRRRSSDPFFDYDRNQFLFDIQATF